MYVSKVLVLSAHLLLWDGLRKRDGDADLEGIITPFVA